MDNPDYSPQVLAALMREAVSLRMFNKFILVIAKAHPEFKRQVHDEATRRKYVFDKDSGSYV